MSKVYLNAPPLHSTIVAWVMGIYIATFFIFIRILDPIVTDHPGLVDPTILYEPSVWVSIFIIIRKVVTFLLIPVLVIGGLLIYRRIYRKGILSSKVFAAEDR